MELDLKTYFAMLWKRKWIIGLIVIVSSLAAWGISTVYVTPLYQATTKIVITKAADSPGAPALDINTMLLNVKLVDTYKELIVSPAIMEIVSKRYPELKLSAEQMLKKVKVISGKETTLFTIQARETSYEKASQLVNAVSETFKQQIQTIMKTDNIVILKEADSLNPPPVTPNIQFNTIIAFIVSLIVASGCFIASDLLSDTIKTEDDVMEHLKVPTLAVIAKLRRKELYKNKRKSFPSQVGEAKNVTVN
ncbi:YveK family protein [Paenibacillus thalictri]|nr:Wzz/FepE/Etk N-terminal domain-containing protein [Paenibacillus thalictri]